MPLIERFACNECDLQLPTGWGGQTYAMDDLGRRVMCPHPSEIDTIRAVTGMGYAEARAAGRTGFASDCICRPCLTQCVLDLDRHPRLCPACGSDDVRSVRELLGKPCPRCKVGVIEAGSPVRWALDPDWGRLPVPEVVVDLVQYMNERVVSDSLRRAAEVADEFGEQTFVFVVLRLLQWWTGDVSAKDRQPAEAADLPPTWTTTRALPEVLRVTPALVELIVIRDGRCWYADGLPDDVRRGIKNYVRKYHKVEVVT